MSLKHDGDFEDILIRLQQQNCYKRIWNLKIYDLEIKKKIIIRMGLITNSILLPLTLGVTT